MQVRRKYLAKYGEMEKTKPHLEETWHSDKKRGGEGGERGERGHNMHPTSSHLPHTPLICTTRTSTRSIYVPLAHIPCIPGGKKKGGGTSKHNKHRTKRSNHH